jgi:hypothetical protein
MQLFAVESHQNPEGHSQDNPSAANFMTSRAPVMSLHVLHVLNSSHELHESLQSFIQEEVPSLHETHSVAKGPVHPMHLSPLPLS